MTTSLDKSKFEKNVHLLALSIPQEHSSEFMKVLKGHLFTAKKIKTITVDPNDENKRLILLDSKYTSLAQLPEKQQSFIQNHASHDNISCVDRSVTVGYDQMTADQVLKTILPENCEIPSAFEQIGHIAHLNLRDAQLPYKEVIGQVILDKSPTIKTVVNKVGVIESVFREAQLELLAGEENYEVEAKEHGIRYRLNFSQVYWNSRLSQEHQRVLKYVKKEHIVCDMMAGIGPFAIPAAKKIGCKVYANDLNPKSFEYMKTNTKLNKVDKLVECYNMDGRDFMRMMVEKRINFDHVLMNLPGSAVEFLDVFVNLFPESHYKGRLPMIHVYTFVRGDTRTESDAMKETAKRNVEKYLSVSDPSLITYTEVYDVRDVAPKKGMYCVSFQLPEGVALLRDGNSKRKLENTEETETSTEQDDHLAKKRKLTKSPQV